MDRRSSHRRTHKPHVKRRMDVPPLMTSRIANMTDDPGVKEMLAFNLARDTYHQQQWLLASSSCRTTASPTG
jgi:Manganese containing catalase